MTDPLPTPPSEPHITTIRNETHGDFAENAFVSQSIKRLYTKNVLSDVHREALDMIALKISRIVSGKADVKDHWLDIQGYAKLAEDACQ